MLSGQYDPPPHEIMGATHAMRNRVKLEHAESKALKAYDEKKVEVETLKSSLKNSGLGI